MFSAFENKVYTQAQNVGLQKQKAFGHPDWLENFSD